MTTSETLSTSIVTAGGGGAGRRDLFFRSVTTAGQVIAGVRPDQVDLPTPCPDFDVRGLMDHLVMVLRRVATIGRGDDPFAVDPAVPDRRWSRAWWLAAQEALEGWSSPSTLEKKVRLPWTEKTGAETLAIYTVEVTVHTWDLARATRQAPAWDGPVVLAALDAIRAELPAAGRRQLLEAAVAAMPAGTPASLPFADAVEVPDDAPPLDRLVAWTGRRP